MIALPLLLVSILFLPSLPREDDDGCRRCDHRGVVACTEHTKEILEHEAEVLFCSVIAGCELCSGALLIPCKHCDGGPDNHLIPERQAEVLEWMKEQPMADFLGRPVPTVELERYELVIDTGPLKLGKKTIDGHVIMHRVASDVKEVARLIGEHFLIKGSEARALADERGEKNVSRDYGNKMRMWIWNDPKDHQRVMAEFLGSSSTGDFKLLGRAPVFSVWTEEVFK
ncbi:MAG: hypothetical protein ACI9F9_003351, partial [Candidatus Paceibacteria bacterium]